MLSTLAALAGLEIRAATQRGAKVAGLSLLALIFMLAAIFYGFAALGEWLRLSFAPANVELMLAALALAVALMLGLSAYLLRRAPLDRSASNRPWRWLPRRWPLTSPGAACLASARSCRWWFSAGSCWGASARTTKISQDKKS